MHITRHARYRFSDRAGHKRRMVDRVARKALADGLRHRETTHGLRRFLDYLYLSHRKANNMRVYQDCVYLFQGSTLITVLTLPQKFRALARELWERKSSARHIGVSRAEEESQSDCEDATADR